MFTLAVYHLTRSLLSLACNERRVVDCSTELYCTYHCVHVDTFIHTEANATVVVDYDQEIRTRL